MDLASPDAKIPWHYGDPFKEQRALVAGNGRVDLSNREIVKVTGPDRNSWLNSLTTQEMLTPFKSTQSLILSPHGHIEHDLHAIDDGQTTWLIVEPNTAENLAKYLDSMKFMLRVEVKAVSDNYAVVGAPGWIETNFPTWHSPNAYVDFDNDPYVTKRPAQWKVTEYIVPKEQLSNELINPVGSWAWEAHRIRAGVARLNFETDHKTIPHEVGLIGPAVHLNKGCYRGQETIARVVNLGKPPRRLVHLELDGSTNELPKLGDEVTHDGQVVGRITSVVQDYESGPVALAVIKRNISPELVLTVNNISASQTPIVNI
jgi:hypothetical protein